MVSDQRQGWTVLVAMSVLFVAGAIGAMHYEQQGNPQFAALGVDEAERVTQAGGNMEGKETRFGIAESALFATITTDASCGAVNAMHDSFTPLGGMVPLVNMQLGEVGEEHREPQPQGDGQDEAGRRLALAAPCLRDEQARDDAADVDDEHHRVAPLHARVELLECVPHRRLDQRRVEQSKGLASHDVQLFQRTRCSITGPSASAGT